MSMLKHIPLIVLLATLAACSKTEEPSPSTSEPPVDSAVKVDEPENPEDTFIVPKHGEEPLDLTYGDRNMMPVTIIRAPDYKSAPDPSALPASPPPLTEADKKEIRSKIVMPGMTKPGEGVPDDYPISWP